MAVGSFADFTEMHTSFLQEIANMGAGNAATSLSNMISEPTDISVPSVRIISTGEACQLAAMLCSRTEAYLITLSGDLKGNILFIIPYQFVSQLVGTFFPGTAVNGKADMNEMAVLKEMLKKLTAEDRERVLTFVHDLQDIGQTAAPAADRQAWNAPH